VTRLAVATWPSAEVVAVLAALERPALPGVRWSTPEQWMVKLRPLGHVDERLVPPLVAALGRELDGAPAVECRLGPATRRLGGQWLGAPVAGLEELAAAVFAATEALVPVTHPQPFQADVVLARGRVPRELAGRPLSASWAARSAVLVADRSSPGAVRHQDLAVFPLDAWGIGSSTLRRWRAGVATRSSTAPACSSSLPAGRRSPARRAATACSARGPAQPDEEPEPPPALDRQGEGGRRRVEALLQQGEQAVVLRLDRLHLELPRPFRQRPCRPPVSSKLTVGRIQKVERTGGLV
jgi:2'-5' RNA ligase